MLQLFNMQIKWKLFCRCLCAHILIENQIFFQRLRAFTLTSDIPMYVYLTAIRAEKQNQNASMQMLK